MNKGERTRQEILNQGMKHSSQFGLADVTIGTIANLCGLSRTGVISHFANKEDMQVAILRHAEKQFVDNVLRPAKHENALVQLQTLLKRWIDWTQPLFHSENTGCPMVKAIVEFKDRPASEVQKVAIEQQQSFLDYLARLLERGKQQGLFVADLRSDSMAYEIYSLYLGHAIASKAMTPDKAHDLFQHSIQGLIARCRGEAPVPA
ncbi:TetR/AcrR family transcriptional regulator [Aliiglaciecola sp. CAU 1673]|uniref:TetR/AcrR family transcriptional regulator n=1 Tax=Aliiglaciecola sp. CAU 1673 TaxID=3032595 RepID=UPI0023DA4C83|nr:TetR/AcrR family transcriptional regulator [Aliiglaciecola sp. CAU 1673]MDF2180356.1 TetR/AcrR family transcriptional regulator [Aliiglaciecola sp. CAU 1673]